MTNKENDPAANGVEGSAVSSKDIANINQTGVAGNYPVIVSWWKINGKWDHIHEKDIAYWLVKIEGSEEKLKITNIRDITDYKRFTDQCLEQLNMVFMPDMKPRDWATVLKDAQSLLRTWKNGKWTHLKYEDEDEDEGGET